MLVARRLPDTGVQRLAQHCEVVEGGLDAGPERLRELVPGVAAIVADPAVRVDAGLLEAAGAELRIVANFGVGYDNVDLEACRSRNLAVTNTPDVLTDATAELALALTLAAARGVNRAEESLREGNWVRPDPDAYLGLELSGTTFGIVGMGRIGRRYAEMIQPLAGRILYAGRSRNPGAERELGAVRVPLGELLRSSDVVSLHVPSNSDTEGMIGPAELEDMRSTAVLVNTARGNLVDERALGRALRCGSIAAAGLDVYEHEPQVSAVLLGAPGCVLLPHIGSATSRTRNSMASLVADSVIAAIRGDEPANRVA